MHQNTTHFLERRQPSPPASVTPAAAVKVLSSTRRSAPPQASSLEMLRVGRAPRSAWHVEDAALHRGGVAIDAPPQVSVRSLLETSIFTAMQHFD